MKNIIIAEVTGGKLIAITDSKMGTEVVGTFTHADAPQRGNASCMRFSLFTINTLIKLFFAGATHAG
jgi:hypothetical protein